MSKTITQEMRDLLRAAGSSDPAVSSRAAAALAVALTTPIRQGVLNGDTIAGIFEATDFEPGAATEYPLDFLSPGTEKDHVAYTVPNQGRIPERHVEGDYVLVPTYDIGNSIDWDIKYSEDARWDVVGRAMQVLEAGFVRKMNDDGWRVLLAAAKGRGLMVYDSAATAGLFTKRLVSLGKVIMRRNAGGNSTSVGRGRLTDLYISPEGVEDIRSWDLTQVDEVTRREIMMSQDGIPMTRVFGVFLHDLDELGEGQLYQKYFTDTLGGSMTSGKLEIAVGLDLEKNDSFVMPVKQRVQVFDDPTMHRQRRQGWYGWARQGFGCLDVRRVVALNY